MAKYYVYLLSYPESMGGAVFYVGKGSGTRMHHHEQAAKRGETLDQHVIIRAIWAAGEQVIKEKIFETDIERTALDYEHQMIRHYAATVTNKGARPQIEATKPEWLPLTHEQTFQMALDRAYRLNASQVLRFPEDQRDSLLAAWNTASERRLRRSGLLVW